MMAVAVDTITIALESECDYPGCAGMATRLHAKLDTRNYKRGVSLMLCPDSRAEWESEHRTARKRAWRSERLGYRFDVIDRSLHNDDIHAINTSMEKRQGRKMADGYLIPHKHGRLPHYDCDRHRIHTYGVLKGQQLFAYLTLYRCGDLALVSMILGHGAHLRNDIMYLLAAGTLESHAGERCWFYYNRHDSGTKGLVYYKERIGFEAMDIEWAL